MMRRSYIADDVIYGRTSISVSGTGELTIPPPKQKIAGFGPNVGDQKVCTSPRYAMTEPSYKNAAATAASRSISCLSSVDFILAMSCAVGSSRMKIRRWSPLVFDV